MSQQRILPILSREDLRRIPATEWLIEGILPARSLSVLYGPPGVGKTFVALDMALSIAAGVSWKHHATKQAPILYLLAEGHSGLPARVHVWEIQNQREAKAAAFVTVAPQFTLGGDLVALIESIRRSDLRPALIVVDTLARHVVGADENSQKDMGIFIAACDHLRNSLECSVLVVHHSGKGGARQPVERGSSVLRGAADVMISVTELSDGQMQVACDKQKESEPFPTLSLRRRKIDFQEATVPRSSCVLDIVDDIGGPADTRSALSENAKAVLRALTNHPEGLRPKDILAETRIAEATYYRTQDQLLAMKFIEKDGANYRVTQAGQFKTLTINLLSNNSH